MPRSGAGKYNHLGRQPLVWRSRIGPFSPELTWCVSPPLLTQSSPVRLNTELAMDWMDCSECGVFLCPSKHDLSPFGRSLTDGVMLCGFPSFGFPGRFSLTLLLSFPPPLVEWCYCRLQTRLLLVFPCNIMSVAGFPLQIRTKLAQYFFESTIAK